MSAPGGSGKGGRAGGRKRAGRGGRAAGSGAPSRSAPGTGGSGAGAAGSRAAPRRAAAGEDAARSVPAAPAPAGAPANADAAELEKFGAQAAAWWDLEGPFKTLHDINPLRLEFIAARAALEGARVLDVGCGGGILGEALAARGARVTGLDLAEANVAAARAHAAAAGLEIDYRCESVEAVAAAEPEAFDVVVCLELLEHVPDPGSVISACAAAARPGAEVFFSTINRTPKSFALAIVAAEYLLGMLPRGTHEYAKLIKPHELARGARVAGLDVVELAGLHYNPLTREYRLGGNVDVNYLVHAHKPGRP